MSNIDDKLVKTEELSDECQEEIAEVAKDVEGAYSSFIVNYLKLFSKRCFEWVSIYAFGFFNLSFGWLMAPLFFMVLREKRARAKQFNFDIVRSIANTNEKEFITAIQKYTSLPSWVSTLFIDFEII